jgi:hypothetical protein
MRFVEPFSTRSVMVGNRKGDADVAKKACLRSDITEEWGDVSTFGGGRCPSKNVRELEAIFRIEEWGGFAVCLLVDAEECWAETVPFGPKQARRRTAIVRNEDEWFRADEEIRIDFQSNLGGEAEEIHGRRGEGVVQCM